MRKRFISFILVLSLCASFLVVPVSAARSDGAPFGAPQPGTFPAGYEDGSSWALWDAKFGSLSYADLGDLLAWLLNSTEYGAGVVPSPSISDARSYWNYKVDAYGVGSCSLVWLTWWADILTNRMNSSEMDYPSSTPRGTRPPYQKLGLNRFNIEVRTDSRGYQRLYDVGNSAWIVDSQGLYVYYAPDDTPTTGYQWMRISDVSNALSAGETTLSMVTRSALSNVCKNLTTELGQTVRLYTWDDNFQCAYRPQGALVLCDLDGHPLMCPTDASASQGAQGGRGEDSKVIKDPDTTTDSGGNTVVDTNSGTQIQPVEHNETTVNYTTYEITLPTGGTQSLDQCYFNNDGNVYVVQAQQNGLLNTGDVIVDSYNTYEYTYNISYSYVTYIGSTAEFTPAEYAVFYTLPDGRSSADLTAEELEQLNIAIDVVDYSRSTDDVRLRSLYHFDGNVEDSSFWNYQTSFDWASGASLTYLESNAFNGCLYLDKLVHDFSITLPSALGSSDFTVDFRYYQSETATANSDSYVMIGGQEVLRFTGTYFVFNGSSYATPVGTWNHLAFVREDGTLKFFLNGVLLSSKAFSFPVTSQIRFYFGSGQQTFKYLDELRVTNFAVWDSNFTPPTVPYDTNLALVLPTDLIPVADEYVSVEMTGTNLIADYSNFAGEIGFLSALTGRTSSSLSMILNDEALGISSLSYYGSSYQNFPCFTPNDLTVDVSSLGCTFSLRDASESSRKGIVSSYGASYVSINRTPYPAGALPVGLTIPFNLVGSYLQIPFTFSMVGVDGTVYSYTVDTLPSQPDFYYYSGRVYSYYSSEIVLNGYICTVWRSYYVQGGTSNTTGSFSGFSIIPTSAPGEFCYLALEHGTESTVTAEYHGAVVGIPADDLNTPTLAVRSDIPTTDYQIGGVRPSFAERGQVYAMVESGFITSLQQYTGYAWQAVDGRIWTGERWIPYSSYNVITFSDMWDIADASGQTGYEYIYTESGFWAWWQKAWNEFIALFKSTSFGGGGTIIEGDTINNDYDVDIDFSSGRGNSVGLLDFVQEVLGDVTSGFADFTGLYLSPDDSLDVLFPAGDSAE